MVEALVACAPYLLRGEVGVSRRVEFCPAAVIGVEVILHGVGPQICARRLDVSKRSDPTLIVAEDHCRSSVTGMVNRIRPDFLPAIYCAGAVDSGCERARGSAGAAAEILRFRHKCLQDGMATGEQIRTVPEIGGISIRKVGKDMVLDAGSIAAAATSKRSLIVIQDYF
jgi:hypothetical protein